MTFSSTTCTHFKDGEVKYRIPSAIGKQSTHFKVLFIFCRALKQKLNSWIKPHILNLVENQVIGKDEFVLGKDKTYPILKKTSAFNVSRLKSLSKWQAAVVSLKKKKKTRKCITPVENSPTEFSSHSISF